jgi:hypothetical protein
MADTPTFQSNPYGSFDPSQWTNPYSNYYGKALPWPSSYAGAPTNAQGQAIQPPPGMTLNQTPAQPQQAAALQNNAQQLYQMMSSPSAMNPSGNAAFGMANWGFGLGPAGAVASQSPGFPGTAGTPGQGQGAAAAPAAGASAAPNNWQQTLSMLANPGHVTTPGATVAQAPSTGGQPTPGVLQNFLANWKPASSGAGSGFTQNFNTILRGLQGGS